MLSHVLPEKDTEKIWTTVMVSPPVGSVGVVVLVEVDADRSLIVQK